MTALVILVYLLIGVALFFVSVPRMAWAQARSCGQIEPDDVDKEDAIVAGFFLGLFWIVAIPVIAFCFGCYHVYKGIRWAMSRVNMDFWSEPKSVKDYVRF